MLRALGLGLFAWLVTRADWAEFARVLQGVDATLLYVLPALFFGFCFAVPVLMGFACWLKNPLSLAELRKGTSKPLGKP